MTTQAQAIPFGEWLPDLPQHMNPGALIAKNVIPQLNSYRKLESLSSFSNALTGACLGTFWAQNNSNVVNNFAGDAAKLYKLSAGVTWADVSGVSAPFTATNWEFTKFGDRVIALNIADQPQKYDLASDSVFADLAGSPPKAAHIAVVRDFVVLGDITGLGPNFVQWCGYNNSEAWTPSLATQSDFQEIFGRGGRIQRIVPGEYGIIFSEQSIYRMDYAGPPTVFQFDEVEKKRGTPAPNSVVWTGGMVYYYGWDGFYRFDGFNPSVPISANRCARWFENEAASDGLDTMRGVVDRRNRLIIWAFRTSTSISYNNRLIIYNWAAGREGKWTFAEVDTQVIDEYVAPGFTLDELDVPLSAGIDTDSILVDSTAFQGGSIGVQAFNTSNQAATFSGPALAAVIDTKEISSPDNRRIFTNSVRPLVEASGASVITVSVGTRNKLQDNANFLPAKAVNAKSGEASVRANARYQRFRVNIANGFEHGNGVKPQIKAGSKV